MGAIQPVTQSSCLLAYGSFRVNNLMTNLKATLSKSRLERSVGLLIRPYGKKTVTVADQALSYD